MRWNRESVLRALQRVLPLKSPPSERCRTTVPRVLEVASGTGADCAFWAQSEPTWRFHPSEYNPVLLTDIRTNCSGLSNVGAPVLLDSGSGTEWPFDTQSIDAVCAVNLCHVVSEDATRGLFTGAARVLRPGGVLCLYGPFRTQAATLSMMGRCFDAVLRFRNPQTGLRDLEELLSDGTLGHPRLQATAIEKVHGDHYCCLWTQLADGNERHVRDSFPYEDDPYA